MQRKLGFVRPGEYRVRWTTVSRIDSRTLTGSYTFRVGRATEGGEGVADSPLDSEGLLGLVGRFVGLGELSLWAGMAVLGGVALRAGVRPEALARLGRWAPIAVLGGMALAALSAAVVASERSCDTRLPIVLHHVGSRVTDSWWTKAPDGLRPEGGAVVHSRCSSEVGRWGHER